MKALHICLTSRHGSCICCMGQVIKPLATTRTEGASCHALLFPPSNTAFCYMESTSNSLSFDYAITGSEAPSTNSCHFSVSCRSTKHQNPDAGSSSRGIACLPLTLPCFLTVRETMHARFLGLLLLQAYPYPRR